MLDVKLFDTTQPIKAVESDIPQAKRGSVVVKIDATPLLSYTQDYLQGKLPYMLPPMPFTPGTNAIGTVYEVGEDVVGLQLGQRVVVDCNWVKDEGVEDQQRVLIGLTGITAGSMPMLEDYPNGTWREYGDFPASVVMPIDNTEATDSATLAAIAKLIVPFGGLRRMNLKAGETVIINGSSGYFGSAAALLALSMGANVILTGRSQEKLEKIASAIKAPANRYRVVAQSGDFDADVAALKAAFGNGAHKALCMVGQARDSHSTLVTLNALKFGGQLVMMGSTSAPLNIDYNQMLLNNWEIKGNFMYTKQDYLALIAMVKSGLVDLSLISLKQFSLSEIDDGIEAAKSLQGLDSVILTLN
ncbi:zinc-binding dehydrogenase [Vibrio sp. D404a]|uniref:MDR/zinc-dependent alcohol dehydrogenase-like family protein n=1 Tax=unclassified Vibrio TaxID=2614977 RepID=UPI002553D101|nr:MULTISPECIES: medium chain dehydrogenase/reductase family protein [unclassified Vibrio]MDK9735943.1 zinc-binding dehydrogenase [Vibrio sp. D404a]MDK9797891.1 zinc-binding dehydrogenase [Vibrio sp. D449a]